MAGNVKDLPPLPPGFVLINPKPQAQQPDNEGLPPLPEGYVLIEPESQPQDIPPLPPGFVLESSLNEQPADPNRPIKDFMAPTVGLIQGANDIVNSASQLLFKGMSPEDQARNDERIREQEAYFDDITSGRPKMAGFARTVGNVASLPLPAAKAASVAGRLLQGSAQGAAQGALEPVEEGESRMRNAATGAVFGAGGQLIGEGIGAGVNKFVNARKGRLNVSEDAAEAIKFADAEGLPLRADDVTKSPMLRKAGGQIDEVPLIGGAKSRREQQAAIQTFTEGLNDRLGAALDRGYDSPYEAVTAAAKRQRDFFKNESGKRYQAAFKQLNKFGEFDLPEYRQVVSALIKEHQKLGTMADPSVINALENAMNAPAGNFEHWHTIHSEIGGIVRAARKGQNAVVGDRAASLLEQAQTALGEGLDQTAEMVRGAPRNLWRDANAYYKNTVVKYKRGPLQKALKDDDPEKLLNLLLGSGQGIKPTDSQYVARQLYRGLDKPGRDTVRHAMLAKAIDVSTDDAGIVSSARLSKQLDNLHERTGVFFTPEDKALLDGYQKYLRFADKAGLVRSDMMTGRSFASPAYAAAMASGMLSEPVSTVAAGAGVYAISRLLNTRKGRSLLLAYRRVTPESKQAHDIAQRINQFVSVQGSAASG